MLGRYGAWNTLKRLRLNVWADWDADGKFDAPGEHVLADLPVDPEDFGLDGRYTLGDPFDDNNNDGTSRSRANNQQVFYIEARGNGRG